MILYIINIIIIIYIYNHCKTPLICPFLYKSLLFCVPLPILSVVLPSWQQTEKKKKNLFVVVLLLWLSLVCDKAQETVTAFPYPPHPSHQPRSQPLQSVEKDPTPFFPSPSLSLATSFANHNPGAGPGVREGWCQSHMDSGVVMRAQLSGRAMLASCCWNSSVLLELALAIPLAYGPPSLMMYLWFQLWKVRGEKHAGVFICPFCKLHFFCEWVKLQRALFIVSQLSVRASRAKRKSEREIERVLGLVQGFVSGKLSVALFYISVLQGN